MTTKKKIKIKVKKTKTKTTQSGNIVKVNITNKGGVSGPASSGGGRGAPSGPSIIVQQPQSQPQQQPNAQLLEMLQRAYAQNQENNVNFRRLNPYNNNDINNANQIAQTSALQIANNIPIPDQINRAPLPPLPPLRRPAVIQRPIQPQQLSGMDAVIAEIKRRQQEGQPLVDNPIQRKGSLDSGVLSNLPLPQTTEEAIFRLQTQPPQVQGELGNLQRTQSMETQASTSSVPQDIQVPPALVFTLPTQNKGDESGASVSSEPSQSESDFSKAETVARNQQGNFEKFPSISESGSIASEQSRLNVGGGIPRKSAEQKLLIEGQKNILPEGSSRRGQAAAVEQTEPTASTPRSGKLKLNKDQKQSKK
jgi:hypothetical protein